jgi:hypothetical protein
MHEPSMPNPDAWQALQSLIRQQQEMLEQQKKAIEQQEQAIAYLQQIVGQVITNDEHRKKALQQESQKLDQHALTLQRSAQQLSGSADQLISETVRGIKAQTQDVVQAALTNEANRASQASAKFVESVSGSCKTIDQHNIALEKTRKKLLWQLSMPLVVGAILCIVGSAAYVASKLNEVAAAKTEYEGYQNADIVMRAYNASDVVICGNVFCGNLAVNGQGEKALYRPMKARLPSH